MTTKELVWREVSLQRPYEMDSLWAILTHIAALTSRGQLVWEARCKNGKMRYLLGTPKWSVTRVQEAFKAHVNAQFTDGVVREPVSTARRMKISRPVLSLNTEVSGAMIRAALAAMTGAKKDTECVLQIVLGAPHTPSTIPKRVPDPTKSWLEVVLGSVHNASAEQRRTMREKAEQYSFEAVVRIGMSGEHTATRLNNIISAMRTLEAAGVHIRAEQETAEHLDKATLPWRMPLRLSVKETACFLLLPAGEEELPGTPGLHPKLLLPPKWYREPSMKADRTFAMTLGSDPKRLSIAPKDALEHSILLGPTGSGKSTAMQSIILSDIKAGRSVLVVDPKADLVTSILERIPEERKHDVVVIDPSDASPVGFNPLALPGDPTLITDSILAVFQELFSQNWGIRSADILSGALLTLCQIKGANLLWLPQMLIDENFRRELTVKVKDPIALQPFWNHFEAMKDTERRTEIAPVLNKLRQITYRPGLRNVLGQSEPKFSLADLFYKRKIVLVPLNRGLIGAESARLLGSLIVGLTWSLALSRANVAPEKRHMVSIFIDELQDYCEDFRTKRQVINHGEVRKYEVSNSHEAIISETDFLKVQEKLERNRQENAAVSGKTHCIFSGLLRCGLCGSAYVRRISNTGKYRHYVWTCRRYDQLGKEICSAKPIPESILIQTAKDVLGLDEISNATLTEWLVRISVPCHHKLIFQYKDGTAKEVEWKHKSRSLSWTPEMRQQARERALSQRRKEKTKHE